jgi:hypothetical protein
MKKITLLFLVCLTFPVYSQYLEQRDIDIFFNNIETFDSAFGAMPDQGDPVWERYQETGERLTNQFMRLLQSPGSEIGLDGGEAEVERFKILLDEFFSLEVPTSIEASFKQAGWEKNGNKKMFTLLFGVSICVLYEEFENRTDFGPENPAAKTLSSMKGIFAPSDWEILMANFERFKDL